MSPDFDFFKRFRKQKEEHPTVTGILSKHPDEDTPKWDNPRASGGMVYATGQFKKDPDGNIVTKSVVFKSSVVDVDHPLVQIYLEEGIPVSFS
jgi:hypothetical protein